jgi:hypothetical protein
MTIVNILIAAAGGFAFGALWYMLLSKHWIKAANIACDDTGRPLNQSVKPFILSAIAMIIVAGMMRHVFVIAEISTLGAGLVSGLGVGLFFISPWIMINNAYGDRPVSLTLIDGGYATFGCAIIGALLCIF